MIEIIMPKLSDSMEEGTILTWLKHEGEHVQVGDDLVEIETDKATMTHAAEAAGLLHIVAADGTTMPVGTTIATLGDPDRTPSSSPGSPAPPSPGRPASPERGINSSGPAVAEAARAPVVDAPPPRSGTAPVKSTPLARRVARIHGIALEGISGSGPAGRVTRADVLTSAGIGPEPGPISTSPIAVPRPDAPVAAPTASPATVSPAGADASAAAGSKGDVRVVEPTRLQAVIARRMAEAKATIPEFQVQTDAIMDAAMGLRQQLKETGANPPSFNDLIVKAAALALRAHPMANAAYRDGRFELYSRVNVGIAVAAEGALIVPTIFDADQKSLGTIAAESRQLASGVRDGTITPGELTGATFTVSNLGMYGMTAITPVINPPQAAILGVGSIRTQLARVGREIVEQHLMTLTLSCDHRLLYGADAARFLSHIREHLEQPLRLVV
jgi:pyruvate dehydrogenase E2 component (dihydrolipoamide acetyltransferase)